MIKEKTRKRKTVRGSVLFTTVSVLALLIIFLTGALALASSANNRAHRSYSSSQASYNARAAIDAFTQAMIQDPDVAAAVHDMSGAGLQPVLAIGEAGESTELWESGTSNGWGTIGYYDESGDFQEGKIDVRPTGNSNEYGWNEAKNEWQKLTEFKITATARYGREEETLVAYVKTLIDEEPNETVIKGLQSLGEVNEQSSGIIYGGLGVGLNASHDPLNYTYAYGGSRFATRTELTFVNGSVSLGNGNNEIGYYSNNSKTVILGNFEVVGGSKLIFVDYSETPTSQKEVPYFFVNGLLHVDNAQYFVRSLSATDSSKPFNIFTGTFYNASPVVMGSADLYMMDEVSSRTYTINGTTRQAGKNQLGTSSTTNLYKWAYDISGQGNYEYSAGGNVYCKGDLDICGDVNIKGDLRVEGNCTMSGNTNIGGKVIVGGNLTVTGNLNGVADSNVYVGGNCSWSGHENNINKGSLRATVQTVTNTYQVLFTNTEYYRYVPSGGVGLFGETGCWNAMNYKYGTEYDPAWTEDEKIANIDPSLGYLYDWDSLVEYGVGNWIDGRDGVTVLEHQEDGDTTYYENGVRLEPQSSAFDVALPTGMSTIYPSGMTREAIYGECNEYLALVNVAPDSTKLITTLDEARAALNIDLAEGDVDKIYDAATLLKAKQIMNDDGTYDSSKIIDYTGGNINSASLGGKTAVKITGSVNSGFDIVSGNEDLNIVLDGVSINSCNIRVNTTGSGSVTFYIFNNLTFNKGRIISTEIEDNDVSYDDDYKIIYYGDWSNIYGYGSEWQAVGSFKTPHMTLYVESVSPAQPNYTYHDEFGNTNDAYANTPNHETRAAMIGNGLFADAQTPNDFLLLYTKTGNSSTSGPSGQTLYSATGDRYELSYYAAS